MIALHTPAPNAPDSPWTPRHRLPKPEPLLRSLAAGLAHNVNNPLLGVIGSLELAMRETGPGTALRDRLQRSLSCALFAAEAVRRLVAYSFHPPGARVLISLRQVAARAARQLHEGGNMHGLMIRLDGEPTGMVRASEPVVELVLDQLLANAREAMPAGGVLALRVWDAESSCRISITDSGPGMSAETKARLFEPFFSTKGAGHLGLGLVLCRDLLESMGGHLEVDSEVGKGTTVTLTIPAASDEARTEPTGPHAVGAMRGSGRGLALCV